MELKEKLERLHELNALLNLEEKSNTNVVLEEEEKEIIEELPKKEETSIVAEASVSWNSNSRVSESKPQYVVEQNKTEKLVSKISIKERLAKMKEKVSIPKETRNKEAKKKQEHSL